MKTKTVQTFIEEQLLSYNAKVLVTTGKKSVAGHYGSSELFMQLATFLYYIDMLEKKTEPDDDLELIYDDETINQLINKYSVNIFTQYSYDRDLNTLFSLDEINILTIEGYLLRYNKHIDTYGYASTIHNRLIAQDIKLSESNVLNEMAALSQEIENLEKVRAMQCLNDNDEVPF